jgi:hypothetical protein
MSTDLTSGPLSSVKARHLFTMRLETLPILSVG